MNDGKLNKREENSKKHQKKAKKLKFSEYDQMIVAATDEKLREIVTKELEEQIASLVERVNQINNSKTNKSEEIEKENEANSKNEKNSTKKNVVLKLRKFKKCLSDEIEIKKRVKLLKTKRRKLRKIVEKVQEKIKNLAKKKLRCFKCRKRGHTIADCKEDQENVEGNENEIKQNIEEIINSEDNHEESSEKNKKIIKNVPKPKTISTILCYNCGSNDHSIHGCSLKVDYSNLPYAECFICNNKGHLSSKCPTSDKGIYVRGGSCFVCKGKDHLAKNCPQRQIQVEVNKDNKDDQLLSKKRRNFSDRRNYSKDTNQDKNFRNRDQKNRYNNKNRLSNNYRRGREGSQTNRSSLIESK